MTSLRLVNADTGERHISPYERLSQAELIEIVESKERKLAGATLQIGKLERELADEEAEQASALEVREILSHCFEVLKFGKRCRIVPGDKRWGAVKKARKHFEHFELKAVPHGALKDGYTMARRHRQKPEWLYADTGRIEELRDLGLGVVDRQLGNGLTLPHRILTTLGALKPWEFDALQRCECGHLKFQHNANYFPNDSGMTDWTLSMCEGCQCPNFEVAS